MAEIPFIKMHGLGNDFVIVDIRQKPAALAPFLEEDSLNHLAIRFADRLGGVGCDQFILIEPARHKGTRAHLRFFNSDGSESGACGNGTRCVADFLFKESNTGESILLTTNAGTLEAWQEGSEYRIHVDMGKPFLNWRSIPLAMECDLLHLPLHLPNDLDHGQGAVGVGFGNPHAVFMVKDVNKLNIEAIGAKLEHDSLFPQRANIGFVQKLTDHQFRIRVWERGAGLTLACGSGASAAAVAILLRRLAIRNDDQPIELIPDGGLKYRTKAGDTQSLKAIWRMADDHLILSGPTAFSFQSSMDLD